MDTEQYSLDYRRIEKAIAFIREHRDRQPGLDEIAGHVHLSPYHFQRLFTRWAGVSPKKFLQYLTLQHARRELEKNGSLDEVAQRAGLSGSGRLHDLFVNLEGMTPDQYRKKGTGMTLRYGFHSSPFGPYLLALTPEDRICSLSFCGEGKGAAERAVGELSQQWSASVCVPDPDRTGLLAATLFGKGDRELNLLARGTPFQLKVWEALLKIPSGSMVSYQVIARYLGHAEGLQAVGNAVGRNPIAWLIPCHRVIRKTGQISQYRWGSLRKSAILAWEAGHNTAGIK